MDRERSNSSLHLPLHVKYRRFFRVAGPICVAGGLILMAVGISNSFSSVLDAPMGPDVPMSDPDWFGKGSDRMHRDFRERGRGMFSGAALAAVGMVVLVGGGTMTVMGYMGVAARYVAGEVAPVASDTFNYAARRGSPGVESIAGAARRGAAAAPPPPTNTVPPPPVAAEPGPVPADAPAAELSCPHCHKNNDSDAKFCKHCGRPIPTTKRCTNCGQEADAAARFCGRCGRDLT